jgi:excisionase family DNA binding protein
MDKIMKKYYGKAWAAERYGVSIHTISSWVKKGYIPFLRCGRQIRFSEVVLEEWDEMRATSGSLSR